VPVLSKDLDFQRHLSWSFMVFSELVKMILVELMLQLSFHNDFIKNIDIYFRSVVFSGYSGLLH